MRCVKLFVVLNVILACCHVATPTKQLATLLDFVLQQILNPCYEHFAKQKYVKIDDQQELTRRSVRDCFHTSDIFKILSKQTEDKYGLIDTFNHVSWWTEYAGNVTISNKTQQLKVIDLLFQDILIDIFSRLCHDNIISSEYSPVHLANEALTVCQEQRIYKLLTGQVKSERFDQILETDFWWQKPKSEFQSVLDEALRVAGK